MSISTTRIRVDDLTFNSIKEATEYLNFKPYEITNALHKGDKVVYKNHFIQRLDPILRKNKKAPCKSLKEGTLHLTTNNTNISKAEHKRVPVLCVTTNKVYNSISELAKELKMHQWTLSVKLESAGKFIDKDGNVYVRQIPMKRRSSNPLQQSPATLDLERSKALSGIQHTVSEEINTNEAIKTVSGLKMLEQAGITLAYDKQFANSAKVFGLLAEIYRSE